MKISGLCPLTYNILWGAPISLRCYVYKDGELINKDSSYAIRYEWSGINITLNGTPDRLPSSENDTVSVNGYYLSDFSFGRFVDLCKGYC